MILYNSREELFGNGTEIRFVYNKHGKHGYKYLLGFKKLDSQSRLRWYTVYFIWFTLFITVNRRGRKV